MAKTCEGDWRKSLIGGSDDGVISIKELSRGFLIGKHNKSGRDLVGQCVESTSHITFVRMGDDGCFHIYDGDIEHDSSGGVDLFKIKNGSVTRVCGPFRIEREHLPPPGDDWTAEKPT